MNSELKFQNDIWASIDMHSKTVFPYTKEQHGEGFVCLPLSFNNDNEMVEALKKVSERINLNQHREAVDIMYDYFKGADFSYCNDGSLKIKTNLDDLELYDKGFMADMESCGCVYGTDYTNDYSDDYFVNFNGTRIATILYWE
jgi:hypothetical protein